MQFFPEELRFSFNLRQPKSKKPTNIYMFVRLDGKQYKLTTGVKVYPTQWNKQKGLAYISDILTLTDNENNMMVNHKIVQFKQAFNDFKAYICSHPNEMNINVLKRFIYKDNIFMGKKKPTNLNVCLIISKEIDKDMNLDEGSKKTYDNYLDWFKRFLKDNSITITSFNEIDSKLFKDFQAFLRNVDFARTKDGFLSVGYINNCVRSLYQRLNTYIVPIGMMDKINLLNISVPIINDKTNDYGIALRDDEVISLWNYKCENKKEELIRDLFVLNCLTGQRISDTQKVGGNVDEIMDITTIQLSQKKTDKFVKCGIVFEIAKEILRKYNDGIPDLSYNDMNLGIKLIAKKAGINKTELVGRQSGKSNKVVMEEKPRYDCISTHTGRRTFITLLKLRGWESTKIALYSGHSNTKMVDYYCKLKDSLAYEIFERTRKEHPELILRMVGENEPELLLPTPQLRTEKVEVIETTTSNGVHTTIVNSIDEAKKVLNYLGADVDDYIEIDDINELLELIGYYHTSIRKKYGSIICDVKEIFNKYADPKMRKQHLHNLLEKMENERQA